VSTKTRFFTIVLGATALAGLTYGVTRRGFQRRALQPLESQTLTRSAAQAPPNIDAAAPSASDWETLSVHSTRGSNPDALDIAMSLDGIFDGVSEDGRALTVRPNVRVPSPIGGDDEDAPSADDLGLAWLMQATQTEQSLTESDLRPELEEIALNEDSDSEETDSDEADVQDEHEDFQRSRT
jgi:hypothetical protein